MRPLATITWVPSPDRYPASAVPWPSALEWSREELARYLGAAGDRVIQALPTRCHPWTVHHLTAHLAATFTRFAVQLDRARQGDLDPPFPLEQLSAVNLRAVNEFQGDPVVELDRWARLFLDAARTPELMGHQLGPIPVGVQVMFGLNEVAVHHDDLARATVSSYRPIEEITIALAGMYDSVFGLPAGEDPWARLLVATGR